MQVIGFALIFVLIGFMLTKNFMTKNSAQPSPAAAQNEVWQLRSIGAAGMTAYVPDSMKQIPVVLDDTARETLESYDAFEYKKGAFLLRINHIKAKNDLSTKEYVNQLAAMFQSQGGVSGFTYDTFPVNTGDIQGTAMKASAIKDGKKTEYGSAVYAEGKDLWEVTVSCPGSDEDMKELGMKIISSVQISRDPQ